MTDPYLPGPYLPGGVTQAALGPLLAEDQHQPRLIWYGAGRTELSTATLANWAAKTAGLLTGELGATVGDCVQWRVHRSWQGAPLLLGAWWAGMVVTDLDTDDAAVAFVDENDDASADEVVVASSHPFGLPRVDIASHQRHVADAVLPQADRYSPPRARLGLDADAVLTALGTVSIGELITRSRLAAEAIGRGGRVLSTIELNLPDGVCTGLLGALMSGGSLIQVAPDQNHDAADDSRVATIAHDERATITLGVHVPGLPRLDA